jgi:hypothetical protein
MSYLLGIDLGATCTSAAVCRRVADGWGPAEIVALGTHDAKIDSDPAGGLLFGDEAEQQVAELACWMVETVSTQENAPPMAVAVTHPASWDEHRAGLLADALGEVGLFDVELLSEPHAATDHANTEQFDAAVLRENDAGPVSDADPDAFTQFGPGDDRQAPAEFEDMVRPVLADTVALLREAMRTEAPELVVMANPVVPEDDDVPLPLAPATPRRRLPRRRTLIAAGAFAAAAAVIVGTVAGLPDHLAGGGAPAQAATRVDDNSPSTQPTGDQGGGTRNSSTPTSHGPGSTPATGPGRSGAGSAGTGVATADSPGGTSASGHGVASSAARPTTGSTRPGAPGRTTSHQPTSTPARPTSPPVSSTSTEPTTPTQDSPTPTTEPDPTPTDPQSVDAPPNSSSSAAAPPPPGD